MAQAMRSDNLLPNERRAMAEELLEQQFMFRQNMALLHGTPMPTNKITLGEEPTPAAEPEPEPEPELPAIDRALESAAAVDRAMETFHSDVKTTAAPAKPKWWKSNLAKAALAAALVGSGVGIPYVGGMLMGKAVEEVQEIVVPGDLLPGLERAGYANPPTDLGGDIQEAFRLNPSLRDQLLNDVQRTLEDNGGRLRPIPDGN